MFALFAGLCRVEVGRVLRWHLSRVYEDKVQAHMWFLLDQSFYPFISFWLHVRLVQGQTATATFGDSDKWVQQKFLNLALWVTLNPVLTLILNVTLTI